MGKHCPPKTYQLSSGQRVAHPWLFPNLVPEKLFFLQRQWSCITKSPNEAIRLKLSSENSVICCAFTLPIGFDIKADVVVFNGGEKYSRHTGRTLSALQNNKILHLATAASTTRSLCNSYFNARHEAVVAFCFAIAHVAIGTERFISANWCKRFSGGKRAGEFTYDQSAAK